MMGIVTVLEGLLPSLPEAVILRQLVRFELGCCADSAMLATELCFCQLPLFE